MQGKRVEGRLSVKKLAGEQLKPLFRNSYAGRFASGAVEIKRL
jgi:hypothetical protein